MSRATTALERVVAFVTAMETNLAGDHAAPCIWSRRTGGMVGLGKEDLRAVVALAKRTEATEREAEGLRRRIALALMAVRHAPPQLDVATQALAPRATKAAACPESSLVAWGAHLLAKSKRATKDATRGAGRKRRRRTAS